MTLTEKKIQRMVSTYGMIASIVNPDDHSKSTEEQMTQLYYFLRDQMQDVERIDLSEAAERRSKANG